MFAQKSSDSRPPSVHVTWEFRRLLPSSKFPQIAACNTKQTTKHQHQFHRLLLLAGANRNSNVGEEYTHPLASLAHSATFVSHLETRFLKLLPESRARHSAKSLKPLCSFDFKRTSKQTKPKISVSADIMLGQFIKMLLLYVTE